MENVLMIIFLAIICFISQIIAIHLEFKLNKKLFFALYSDYIIYDMLNSVLNDDSIRDEFLNNYNKIIGGDKNV